MDKFPLNALPDDTLQCIFALCSGPDIVTSLVLVCKRWKEILSQQTFWRLKCQRKGIEKPRPIDDVDYKHLYFYNPYSRNLVKNWNAADGFNHWKKTANGGDRFKIEGIRTLSYAESFSSMSIQDVQHCWVTSYGWCVKEQMIDLLQEGCQEQVLDNIRPKIVVSEWTTARKDCASTFKLQAYLLSEKKKVLDSCDLQNVVAQWVGGQWTQVKHEFCEYPPGVRFVRFSHGGKDNQFWAGHYGPKFTAASVTLVFED